jgi:hypothetical protein
MRGANNATTALTAAGQNKLLALNYIYQGEDPAVCAAHVEWGNAFQAQFAQQVLPEVLPSQRDTTPGRQLRVSAYWVYLFVRVFVVLRGLNVERVCSNLHSMHCWRHWRSHSETHLLAHP